MSPDGKHQANTEAGTGADFAPPLLKRGRPKGSKNRRTLLGNEFLRSLTPRAKRRLRELLDEGDADLALRAATLVLNYTFGRPVEARELTGADGEAISVTGPADARELARRVALMLQFGDPDPDRGDAAPAGAGRADAPAAATAPAFSDNAQAALQRAVARVNGGEPLTPGNGATPASEALTGEDGVLDDVAEPEPPPPGHRLTFGRFGNETTITNTGPIRPGLRDHVFELRRQHGGLVTSGAWERVIAVAAKMLSADADAPWPAWRTEPVERSIVGAVSEAQMPPVAPMPSRGVDVFAHRKRWR